MSSRTLLGISYRRESYIVIAVLLAAGLVLLYFGSPSLPATGSLTGWAFFCVLLSFGLVIAAIFRDVRGSKS